MNTLILGAQGSGKGTQANLITEKFGWPHVSTGDIFRENIKNRTKLGVLAKKYIDKGELVPDKVTIAIIKDRLSQKDCKNGYVLDGFPRNIAQAKALDKIAKIEMALEVHISDKEAVKRISGRRTCSKCGAISSIFAAGVAKQDKNASAGKGKAGAKAAEACSKCGGPLVIRDDDKPSSVKKRLAIYHQLTEPVISHYKKKKVLAKIDCERPIEVIFGDIKKILK
jgi:adenylate kinase